MINDKYVLPQFKLDQNEIANKKYTFKGKKYRISLITDRIFRFEYSESGVFYNSITKLVYNRNIKEISVSSHEADGYLVIKTNYWTITYKIDAKYDRESLKVESIDKKSVWLYGEVTNDDSLFSKNNYVILDDSESPVFNSDSWFSTKNNKTTDIYFFGYGRDFESGLKDFYLMSGNTPLIPRYAFGNWWSKKFDYHDNEVREILEEFMKNKIPLAAFMLNEGKQALGLAWNLEATKKPNKLIEDLHKQNVRVAMKIKPQMGIDSRLSVYNEFQKDFLSKGNMVEFDILDPRFVASYFDLIIHKLEKDGVDFFSLSVDNNLKTKTKNIDSLFALNHLHFLDSDKAKKRGLLISSYPHLGGQRYAINQSFDSTISFESLANQIKTTILSANLGIGYLSNDIGGSIGGIEDIELLIRWVQFGVFSPILRLHSGESIYQIREPWLFDAEVDYILSHYLRLRHRLIPYIYTHARRNALGGKPIVYPLYYNYPTDEGLQLINNQYFFGEELAIAPVVSKLLPNLNQAKNTIYLPQGNWYDFTTGKKYEGGISFKYYSTLREMPMFAKEGAIIPLAVLSKINQVDNPKEFDIHIFPNKDNEFILYEDDGLTKNYQKGAFVETKIKVEHFNNNLEISFSSKGDLSLISEFRVYNIYLRSVEGRFKVDSMHLISEQYNKDNNTFIIRVVHETNKDIKVVIKGIKEKSHKNYQDEITQLLYKTNYPATLKDAIGYKYNGAVEEITGLLKLEKVAFLKELKKLKIDKELEEAIKSLL